MARASASGGYLLPLTVRDNEVTQFVLIPWTAACSHMPAPPPNQSIRIKPTPSSKSGAPSEPVWVSGSLRLRPLEATVFVVDGRQFLRSTYAIDDAQVQPAVPETVAPLRFR